MRQCSSYMGGSGIRMRYSVVNRDIESICKMDFIYSYKFSDL